MTPTLSPATPSIRALLRDTALQVALLAQQATPDTIKELRQDCVRLIAAFEAALEQRKVAADVQQDALYAQCGLLDETVLRRLPDANKSEWDTAPLQVERFHNHDAGERIYERIQARMRETSPNVELLECYSTILGLGFKGRYARAGETERASLIAALDTQISHLRPAAEQSLIIDAKGDKHLIDWLAQLSPWALAGIAAAATVILYLLLGHTLDLQLSQLVQHQP